MKKLLKKQSVRYLLIMPMIITGIFFYTLYAIITSIQEREREIYSEAYTHGYEVGRFDQLNEDAEDKEFYTNLSANPKVAYLFEKYFPNKEEARIMRAISLAESKGKQTATNTANRNGSTDFGFFQINSVHKKKNETLTQFQNRMHLLEENFKEARRILDTQGISAWATFTNGAYLDFIR